MTAAPEVVAAPDRASTVSTLADLDRDLYRSASRSKAVRVTVYVFVGFLVLGMAALVVAADAGSARVTTACLLSAVVLGFCAMSPLLAGQASGLQPEHVRTLPVSADHYRAAITRRALRQLWGAMIPALLIALAIAVNGDSPAAIALAAIASVPLAVLLDHAPRVVGLRFVRLMRTQAGRVIAVVGGVIGLAVVYAVYLLTANRVIDPDDHVLRVIVRVLPSGWPAVAAEGASQGHWWLSALAIVGLVVLAVALRRDWSGQIDHAMYDNVVSAPSRGSEATRPMGTTTSSAVAVIMRTEARMLVTDPQRLGLLVAPVAFIVIGIVLLFTGFDTYGMQYGAPFIVFLMSSTMTNGYGLDRWGFATMITSRHAAPLIIRARMTLFVVAALPVGLAGTVIARLVRDTDPASRPVAAAVLVGCVASGAAAAAVLPALAPYRVPPGSGMGSINSRGSMSGRSLGLLVVYVAGVALVCAPGVVIGLVLSGPLAWIAVAVEIALAGPIMLVSYRAGVRLVAERGPEILATVTATA